MDAKLGDLCAMIFKLYLIKCSLARRNRHSRIHFMYNRIVFCVPMLCIATKCRVSHWSRLLVIQQAPQDTKSNVMSSKNDIVIKIK